MKVVCVVASFLLFPAYLFAQPTLGKISNELVREIVVEESGIHAVSSNPRDTIVINLKNNAVIYCYPDGTESFWYKIYAKKDCEITFDIFPANEDNTYNYFLYKNAGDLSIADVISKNIRPIRANLYKDEMATSGTGLSLASQINYSDTCTRVRTAQFYHTAYHGAVPAINGDVLLLNIYHIKGTDCGQQFILHTNGQSQKFQSFYQSCYVKEVADSKVERMVKQKAPPPAPIVKKPEKDQVAKASYVVWDSLKHTVLEAEINWVKKNKSGIIVGRGTGEILLEKNSTYSVTVSLLGYKSKILPIVTKDSLYSFSHYVFLSPVQVGEDFSIDKIYFYPNKYAMKPGAEAQVDKLLKYLLANPDVKVEIQGFTNGNNRIKASPDDFEEGSFTGSAKKLSQLRAETIKKYLTDKGVAPDRLETNGFGGSQMIYPKPRNQEEANKNIRVGVRILQRETSFSSNTTTSR